MHMNICIPSAKGESHCYSSLPPLIQSKPARKFKGRHKSLVYDQETRPTFAGLSCCCFCYSNPIYRGRTLKPKSGYAHTQRGNIGICWRIILLFSVQAFLSSLFFSHRFSALWMVPLRPSHIVTHVFPAEHVFRYYSQGLSFLGWVRDYEWAVRRDGDGEADDFFLPGVDIISFECACQHCEANIITSQNVGPSVQHRQ